VVSDRFHEGAIRLENVLSAQVRGLHPFEALPIQAPRLTTEAVDNPHRQLNVSIVVGMRQPHQRAARSDFDTELLT
jgi:hypothetical protein